MVTATSKSTRSAFPTPSPSRPKARSQAGRSSVRPTLPPPLLQQAAGLAEVVRDPLAFLDEPEAGAGARPANAPEVLLVGTGRRQHLLGPEQVRPLLAMGVGVEAMDTQAAARTYNILMAEGRRVVVALLPDGDSWR